MYLHNIEEAFPPHTMAGPFPLMNIMKETFDEVATTTVKATPWWLLPTTTPIPTSTESRAAYVHSHLIIHIFVLFVAKSINFNSEWMN